MALLFAVPKVTSSPLPIANDNLENPFLFV